MNPFFFLGLSVLLLLFGCGGSSSSSPHADAGSDARNPFSFDASSEPAPTSYPSPHPPMPQVQNQGGPVMRAPTLAGITFDLDPLQAMVDNFVSELTANTAYWSGATAEYGVGPLSATTPVHANENPGASLTDAQVQAWLTAKINAAAVPPPTGNIIYVVFYSLGTVINFGGGLSCTDFGAYHNDYQLTGGTFVTYVVVPRCNGATPKVSMLDELSGAASHEIIEAATDPIPQENPAWLRPDPDHYSWLLVTGGGEIGDLCAPFPSAFYKPAGMSTLVQRVWSNRAAGASHDPCQPNGASPYFNSAPVMGDVVDVNDPNIGMFQTKGVAIPVGTSKTVELDLYSDAPTSGPWTVQAYDVASYFFGQAAELSFSFDVSQGKDGDRIHLTIQHLKGSTSGASALWIQSSLGQVQTAWFAAVGN